MDASCGKIIATTKKVIRVTAYMHIRVGKLDVLMSSFQNLVRAKPETQKHLPKWNENFGEIIATTKEVIRVTAYMHIRVSKLTC